MHSYYKAIWLSLNGSEEEDGIVHWIDDLSIQKQGNKYVVLYIGKE